MEAEVDKKEASMREKRSKVEFSWFQGWFGEEITKRAMTTRLRLMTIKQVVYREITRLDLWQNN